MLRFMHNSIYIFMKHFTAGLASSALLLGTLLGLAPSAFAQSTTTPATATVTKVADVNFDAVGINYSTSTRTFSATGFIRNDMGDLSNAIFGLELSGKDVSDAAYSGHFSIKQGGTLSEVATLVIPANVSGAVSIMAVVKSIGGITLASQPVWSGTVVSTLSGTDPLSCKQGGSSSVSCTVAKGQYGLAYTVYDNVLGGRDHLPFSDTNAGGKTFTIPADSLSPGNYAVLIHATDAKGAPLSSRVYDLFVPGSQGHINTFVLELQQAGMYRITATTQAFSTSTADLTLTFQGLANGIACGTPVTVPVTSAVTQMPFSPGCDANMIRATLAADGQTLDTSMASILTKPSSSGWGWPAAVALLILVIIGLVGYAMRRKSAPPPAAPPAPPTPANPITYA